MSPSTESHLENKRFCPNTNEAFKRPSHPIHEPNIKSIQSEGHSSVDKNEKEKLDYLFGLFMYACKEPFSIVESQHFRNFIKALNPGYKLPDRKTISNSLLNKCFDNLVQQEHCEKTEKATLLIDGWKNEANNIKQVVAMIKIRPSGKELLLKAYDLSREKIDALKVGEVMRDACEYGEKLFNLKIDSFISDNDFTMRRAGKDSMLIDYGCLAHEGNLFVHDVYDEKLYEKVHLMLVEYKSNTKLQSHISDLGGKKVYIKGQTRYVKLADYISKQKNYCIFL